MSDSQHYSNSTQWLLRLVLGLQIVMLVAVGYSAYDARAHRQRALALYQQQADDYKRTSAAFEESKRREMQEHEERAKKYNELLDRSLDSPHPRLPDIVPVPGKPGFYMIPEEQRQPVGDYPTPHEKLLRGQSNDPA